jgi:hypothetical protein
MKELSPMESNEVWLNPRYAMARFMVSKVAFKTLDNSNNTLMTAKIVQEKNLPKELQLHIRLNGKDYWNNHEDTLDIDIYIEKHNIEKLLSLLQEMLK